MDAYILLLGKPWEYDREIMHDGYENISLLKKHGEKFKMLPLEEEEEVVGISEEIFNTSRKVLMCPTQDPLEEDEIKDSIDEVEYSPENDDVENMTRREIKEPQYESMFVEGVDIKQVTTMEIEINELVSTFTVFVILKVELLRQLFFFREIILIFTSK